MILNLSKCIYGITFLPDNVLSGVAFQKYQHVYRQIGSKFISYKFNFTSIKYINDKTDFIRETCPNEYLHSKKIKNNLFLNWKEDEFKFTHEIQNLREIITPKMQEFSNYTNSISMGDCNTITKIELSVVELEQQFDKIKNLSMSNIFELIPLEYIIEDTNEIMDKLYKNYVIPITLSKYFVMEFFKISTPQIQYHNNTIYLIFELPYFKNKGVMLYLLYPKPILWENEIYILKTNLRYGISEPFLRQYFTENDYERFCFSTITGIYCKHHMKYQKDCDYKIMNEINKIQFDKKCFTKLNKRNKITQINNQLYFLILKPLELYISHDNIDYTIILNETSKIIEHIDYSIKTPFFQNNEHQYKIFESEETESFEKIFDFAKENSNKILLIVIIFFSVMLIISTLLRCCILMKNFI